MKAVVLPGDETASVKDIADPIARRGEVVVRVRASAICGSDMSAYRGDPLVGSRSGGIVPGHEVSGEVADLGEDLEGLQVGDRVAIYLAIGCLRCRQCRKGYFMLCPEWKAVGFDINGGDAEYVTVPAANVMRLPDALSFAEAAVATDMFGTQFSAQERLSVSGADAVMVLGLGPMGAAAVAVAKARGAYVVGVDPVEHRRELGQKMGADTVLPFDADAIHHLLHRQLGASAGADVAIECSGNSGAQRAALNFVRPFGKVALVGEGQELTLDPSNQMIRKLSTLMGAWYFPIWQFSDIADFLIRRKIPMEAIISHRFGLDEAPEAFQMLAQRTAEKMVFEL